MGDKIQIRGDWDLLAQEAAQAKNAEMAYGAWKARQFQKDQAEIAQKELQYQAYKLKKERERKERREQRRKAREAEGMQEPGNGLKCVQCGAPLRGYQKRYCCQRCSYIYNAEKLKRDRIERYNRKSQAAPERFCPVCGERILGDIRRIYCSDICKREMRKRVKRKRT